MSLLATLEPLESQQPTPGKLRSSGGGAYPAQTLRKLTLVGSAGSSAASLTADDGRGSGQRQGGDVTITLNQASTGVSLFHEIQVYWSFLQEEPRLMLKNPPVKAGVTVNGKKTCYGCRLRDGDILSFQSSAGTHRYKILIQQTAETPRKLPAMESSSIATFEEHQAACASFSAAAEEFSCPVCLEIQFQSTSLVPCGHSLCRSCICVGPGKSTSCPVCRAASRQQVPNRAIDNAIAALSHCPGFFNTDDLAAYMERSGTSTGGASSPRSNQAGSRAAGSSRGGKRRRLLRQELLQGLGSTSEDPICVD